MGNTKQNTPTEKFYLEKKPFDKILFMIGAVGFITTAVLTLTYLGFSVVPKYPVKHTMIPDEQTLWVIAAGLGILGGALMNYRKLLASIPGGLAANVSITGITFAYFSFRETISSYEILIPFFLGSLVGAGVYNLLYRIIYKKKDDEMIRSKFNTELKN